MFTAFTCNGPPKAQFARTACDICRAKNVSNYRCHGPPCRPNRPSLTCLQLKCRGTGESCDGCITSSNACTYTFSSGIGPGKKRRRKVWSPSFNASISQQRPISPLSSSLHEYEGGSRSQNARAEQRSSEWNHLLDIPDTGGVTRAELNRDDTNTGHGHNTLRNSDKDWADMCLSGDGFVLCPGKHMSAVTHTAPQPRSLLRSQPDPESALRNNPTSPLDPDILNMFEVPSPQLRDDPPPTRSSRQSSFGQQILQPGTLDFTPPFTPRPPSSGSSGAPQNNTDTAKDKALGQSSGLSSRCDCLAAIVQRLNEFDLQRSSDIKVALTDTLFLSVENGIDHFSKMLSCNECNINDVNPMLVVTNVNQLALMLSEIVYRLTHCQSPDSVPAIFQFGMYSVQKTKMRTSLLTGLIELHVRCLNQLITRLEKCIADQPRMLLAGARNIVTNMQQTLKAFPGGSHTYYDS
jgi:hypothetical protein